MEKDTKRGENVKLERKKSTAHHLKEYIDVIVKILQIIFGMRFNAENGGCFFAFSFLSSDCLKPLSKFCKRE